MIDPVRITRATLFPNIAYGLLKEEATIVARNVIRGRDGLLLIGLNIPTN